MQERLTEFSRGFLCGLDSSVDAFEQSVRANFADSSLAFTLLASFKTAVQLAREQILQSERGPIQ